MRNCGSVPPNSVLRFVPPFTTTERQFDQVAEIIERAIQRLRA